ncbi:chromosome partitioning protein, ParB family [Solimonas aquatica]|uniref:Probable chromosome-partitioning protein ParB n=1 Tax=Solimonas aquatica TaxID=489703 RepID=A0A1H9J9E3_9GAMM|nr:chromosome partitioning protein, ParB family [Solimonas aquatica]
MSVKKRGLGRSLDVLLSSVAAPAAEEGGEELREIALDRLQPGKHQPRRDFDPAALDALAASIRAQGIVQPLVVRSIGADRYEIVAGERRWRAAQQLLLKTVPVVIRALDERAAMAVALVENIQRADLNALEEAQALHKLIKECGLTHEQAAEAVGCSRAHISNLLRVLDLPEAVQTLLRGGRLSLGHAKVLLGAPAARQEALAQQVLERQLSVRQLEALLALQQADKPRTAPAARAGGMEKELSRKFGLPVRLRQDEQGRGKLTVSFASAEELRALLQRLA